MIRNLRIKNQSFTLIEALVTTGVLIILIAFSPIVLQIFERESDLNNSASEIIDALRFAQNKTLASEGASQYGVYFDNTISPHQYTLFKGASFAGRVVSFDDTQRLPKSVEIYEMNLGGGKEVVFRRISGEPSQAGNVKLRLIRDPGQTRVVYVESSGQAGLIAPSSPINGRLTDSRHVHFNLNWSMQNATELKFNFVAAGQTRNVNTAAYFNPAKTEFDWSGKFNIGGIDQIFRIHTHSLGAFNTLLCIDRDRNNGQTNQEVIVYVVDGGVDKEIGRYLADVNDTVGLGAFGGALEVQ